jgi:hypothetical protein
VSARSANRMTADDLVYSCWNIRAKGLQLQFTVEDEGFFTMPWSATMTYRRALGQWPEFVCAENISEYYNNKD